eukprot:m.136215 g.136215  ORF g.136215 m.136215 type:complete len:911 (+) comp20187_c0_seq2:1648-4380(+)
MAAKPTAKTLCEGLQVVRTPSGDPNLVCFRYDVKNSLAVPVRVTISLEKAINMCFEDNTLNSTADVAPGKTKHVGNAVIIDPHRDWTLRASYAWDQAGGASPGQADAPGEKAKQLCHGLKVVRVQRTDPFCFEYYLENTAFAKFTVEIDISGSKNMCFSQGTLKKSCMVETQATVLAGTVVVAQPSQPWSLKATYNWLEMAPDKKELEAMKAKTERVLKGEIAAFKKLPWAGRDDSLTRRDIDQRCQAAGVRFVDLEFEPCDSSLYGSTAPDMVLEWRRPCDFFGERYQLTNGDILPTDIVQGRLGDCWLLCAISSLAEFPQEIERIFWLPGEQEVQPVSPAGVYSLRLCKNGAWINMRLDDYFPCIVQSTPAFARPRGNEIWVLLLEKAFAKLSGSYAALGGGLVYEALMDLTGCPTRAIKIKDVSDDELWNTIVREDTDESLLSASVPGEDKWSTTTNKPVGGPGLVSGHAYSLVRAVQLGPHRLLELRNPWGNFEWNGDWSDNSELWTTEYAAAVGLVRDEKDGLFWMCLRDFRRYFTGINICHRRPGPGKTWVEYRYRSHFKYGDDEDDASDEPLGAGLSTPWFYECTIEKPGVVWFSVHQRDERDTLGQPYVDVGLLLFKVTSSGKWRFITYEYCNSRQTQLCVPRMDAGTYVVVVFTSGVRVHRGGAKSFADPVLKDADGSLSVVAETVCRELFERFDEDMDNVLCYDDLSIWFQELYGIEMPESQFQEYLVKYDSTPHGLTLDGFRALVAKDSEEQMKDNFCKLGYTRSLFLDRMRSYVFAVHSEHRLQVVSLPFEAGQYHAAVGRWLEKVGTVEEYAGGKLLLYTLETPFCVCLAVKNKFDNMRVVATVDCEGSENVVSHQGMLCVEVEVQPQSVCIAHNLVPRTTGEWTWVFELGAKAYPL